MGIKLKLSVIICTMNRYKDLDLTFHSIFDSSIKPYKIIIIDDSDNNSTEKVVDRWKSLIADVKFVHVHPNYESKSLTKARNTGIKYIDDTDIVLFLDDDVTLNRRYLEEIIKTFEEYPEVAGAQGFIMHKYINKNVICKLILCLVGSFLPSLISASFFTPIVTKTMEAKYPIFIPKKKKIKECQWLSGANMAYRGSILKNDQFRFDENLISYCLSEDVEFSYKLFKNGKKLFMNYDAKILHRVSQEFRIPKISRLLMRFGYKKYLINKFNSNRVLGLIFYKIYSYRSLFAVLIWSMIYQRNMEYFKDNLRAYRCVRMLEKDIENLDLSSLNHLIMSFDRKRGED